MIITLYKNCRLNKSYCEVLDTIAPHTYNGVEYANSLEAYLSTLPKKVFNTGNGTIYGTNSGKIPFELAQGEGLTMYDYNYMKIADETNNFVRYCFILSLQVANGSAIAEYEEDVWASYSATMHVRKSLLTRSRSLKYGNYTIPFYKLGMEYEGNEKLTLTSLKTNYDINDTKVGKCIVVAKIQLYQLVRQGEVGNIVSRIVAFRYQKGSTQAPYVAYNDIPIENELLELITTIKQGQALYNFGWDTTYKNTYKIRNYNSGQEETNWYYEIGDIYIVPAKFGMYLNSLEVGFEMGELTIISDLFANVKLIDISRCFEDENGFSCGRPLFITASNINNDFKTLGIGTYSNLYEITPNGTRYTIVLYASCDDYNFNIYLGIENKYINITDNYKLDIPIAVQTADVTQQQRTARELEILNNEINIVKSTFTLASGFAQTIGSANLNFLASSNYVERATSQQAVLGGVGKMITGATGIAQGVKGLTIANRNMYKTSKGTFAKSVGTTNAYYGLFIISIYSDNDVEVQANIDNGGYVVNEVVDDLLQDMAVANDKPAYNVMQFDFVNNYGAFPEDIRQRLVDILSNGFKIWYNTAEYIAS